VANITLDREQNRCALAEAPVPHPPARYRLPGVRQFLGRGCASARVINGQPSTAGQPRKPLAMCLVFESPADGTVPSTKTASRAGICR